MMWLSAGTLFGMVFAIVALALAVGAAYPNLDADNAAKVAASAGGLVYMILCMSFIGAVVVLEAWPVYAIFTSRFTQMPLERGDAGQRRRLVRRAWWPSSRVVLVGVDPTRHQAAGSDRAVKPDRSARLAARRRPTGDPDSAAAEAAAWVACPATRSRIHAIVARRSLAVARVRVLEQPQAVGVQPVVQDDGVVERLPREVGVLAGLPSLLRRAPRCGRGEQRARALGASMPRA